MSKAKDEALEARMAAMAARRTGATAPEPLAPPSNIPAAQVQHAVERELRDLMQRPGGQSSVDKAYERAREIIQEAYENATELRLAALGRIRGQEIQTERLAQEMVTRARAEAEGISSQVQSIVARARAEAEQVVAEANVEAQRTVQGAQRTADQLLARAKADADRMRNAAQEEAAIALEQAKSQATEIYETASTSLTAARERQAQIQRAEAEFEAAAAKLFQFVGLQGEPGANPANPGSLRNILKRK
jgi:hypothetical protein